MGWSGTFRSLLIQPLKQFAEAVRNRVQAFRGSARANDDELLLAIDHLEPQR